MSKSVKDSAYKKYKQMKKRSSIEQRKKDKAKAMLSLDHNPLAGGPLSKGPLENVKRKK